MHDFIKDGRFVVDLQWARNRARWLQKHQYKEESLGNIQRRIAHLLGFHSWPELTQELGDGILGKYESYQRLSKLPVKGSLPKVKRAIQKGSLYVLSQKDAERIPDLSEVINSLNFPFFDFAIQDGLIAPEFVHSETVYHAVANAKSILDVFDFVLERKRMPRPWRISDYHGNTTNTVYYDNRCSVGIVREQVIRGIPEKEAETLFAKFAREVGIDADMFRRLDLVTDDLLDRTYFDQDAEDQIGSDRSAYSEIARLLHDATEKIDSFYEPAFSPAMMYFESVRYLSWCLRLCRTDRSLLSNQDFFSLTMHIQSFVQQLVRAFGFSPNVDINDDVVWWPPNAARLCKPSENRNLSAEIR